jgi:hypothetical protein
MCSPQFVDVASRETAPGLLHIISPCTTKTQRRGERPQPSGPRAKSSRATCQLPHDPCELLCTCGRWRGPDPPCGVSASDRRAQTDRAITEAHDLRCHWSMRPSSSCWRPSNTARPSTAGRWAARKRLRLGLRSTRRNSYSPASLAACRFSCPDSLQRRGRLPLAASVVLAAFSAPTGRRRWCPHAQGVPGQHCARPRS